MAPEPSEREGYVPNVVYSCGAMLHQGQLIIPYGLAITRPGLPRWPVRCAGGNVPVEQENRDSVAGCMAYASAAVWRLGDGGRQHPEGLLPGGGMSRSLPLALGHPRPAAFCVAKGYEEDRPSIPRWPNICTSRKPLSSRGVRPDPQPLRLYGAGLFAVGEDAGVDHDPGFSSAQIMAVYEKYRAGYFVSISDADRAPGLNYLATVYNGIDLALYPQRTSRGEGSSLLAASIRTRGFTWRSRLRG